MSLQYDIIGERLRIFTFIQKGIIRTLTFERVFEDSVSSGADQLWLVCFELCTSHRVTGLKWRLWPCDATKYWVTSRLEWVFIGRQMWYLNISSISNWRNMKTYSIFHSCIEGYSCILVIFNFHKYSSILFHYSFNISVDFFLQGSEIFTVLAKDGDVGNPNPIRYSFDEGKHFTRRRLGRFSR